MANRRKFVRNAAGWALACETLVTIGIAGCGAGSGDDDDGPTPTPEPTPVGGILTLPLAEYPQLANVDGDQVFTITGTGRIIVAQIAAATFVCVRAVCPHQGTTILWDASLDEFRCPNHGSTFATDGSLTGGPAIVGVLSFPTTFDGTNVVVDLG